MTPSLCGLGFTVEGRGEERRHYRRNEGKEEQQAGTLHMSNFLLLSGGFASIVVHTQAISTM